MMVEVLTPERLWEVVRLWIPEFDVDKDVFVAGVVEDTWETDWEKGSELRFSNSEVAVHYQYPNNKWRGEIHAYFTDWYADLNLTDSDLDIHYSDSNHRGHRLTGPNWREWFGVSLDWNIPEKDPDSVSYGVDGKFAESTELAVEACNPDTTHTRLKELFRGDDPVVSTLVVHNPNCPDELRVEYALVASKK